MTRLLPLLLAVLPNLSTAQSVQAYSFATLSWNDSIVDVDKKLKAQGFSGCESILMLRLKCASNEACECNFNGPGIQDGRAQIRDGKLGLVAVTASSKAATLDALIRKYGPHLPVAERPIQKQSVLDEDPSQFRRWASGEETLTFSITSGVVIYTSPSSNRFFRGLSTPRTDKF